MTSNAHSEESEIVATISGVGTTWEIVYSASEDQGDAMPFDKFDVFVASGPVRRREHRAIAWVVAMDAVRDEVQREAAEDAGVATDDDEICICEHTWTGSDDTCPVCYPGVCAACGGVLQMVNGDHLEHVDAGMAAGCADIRGDEPIVLATDGGQ